MSEESLKGMQVGFARVPLSLPCPVPVIPGSPDTMDANGEPLSLDQRTERCAVDGYWFIGGQPCCDVHCRMACDVMGIDFDDLAAEAGGPFDSERVPWAERKRYPQDDPMFTTGKFAKVGDS